MITAEEAQRISNSCKNKEADIEFDEIMNEIKSTAKKGYTGCRKNISVALKYKTRLEKLGFKVRHEQPFKANIPVQCENAIISWVE